MNEKDLKKFWIFYLISDGSIYAFTDNREYAKLFKSVRNMKKFICKSMMLNIHEYRELIKYNMSSELEMYRGHTKSVKNGKMTATEFTITLTKAERINTNNMSSMYKNKYLYQYAWNTPYIFKDKYVKALNNLLYTTVYKFVMHGIDDKGTIENKVIIDDFEVIMRDYGDYFIDSNVAKEV